MDMTPECGRAPNRVVPQPIHTGLGLLLQAYNYAEELQRNLWDFAVEIHSLQASGLSTSDLRWLVCKGYAEVAQESRAAGAARREFRRHGELRFTGRTCFVLTPAGLVMARQASTAEGQAGVPVAEGGEHGGGQGTRLPKWDPDRHQFRVGPVVVKEFKLPSPNQETILTAFEEEGWPPSIHDPLPPDLDVDPKQRLHDAIKSLNRHQKQRLVRFMGDGTGEGIRWEFY